MPTNPQIDITADPSVSPNNIDLTLQNVAAFGKGVSSLAETGVDETGSPISLALGLAPAVKGLLSGSSVEGQDRARAVRALSNFFIPAIGLASFGVDAFGLNNSNKNLAKTITQQRINAQNDARTDIVADTFSRVLEKPVNSFTDADRGMVLKFSELVNKNFTNFTPADVRRAAEQFFSKGFIQKQLSQSPTKDTLSSTRLTDVVRPGEDVRIIGMRDGEIDPSTGKPFGTPNPDGTPTAPNYFISSTNVLETPKNQILNQRGIETADTSGFRGKVALDVLKNIDPGTPGTPGVSSVFKDALENVFVKADKDGQLQQAILSIFGDNPSFDFSKRNG